MELDCYHYSSRMYKLSYELRNDLQIRILGNEEIYGSLVPSLCSKNKNLATAKKKKKRLNKKCYKTYHKSSA